MQPSFVGLIVCAILLVLGYYSRGLLIVGLVTSLAFGATSFATLSFLGNSSPLIYTLFAAIMLLAVAARRHIWRDLGTALGSIGMLWVLCALMFYAALGSWLFPRLFAGQVSVFVQSQTRRGVIEAALEPVSGNISQTAYFVLGGLTAIALCVLLRQPGRFGQLKLGFFLLCGFHAAMGLIDLLGKLAGAGDVLEPIRTASYAMLTNSSEGGFIRIAGAYSEASAFGTASLACLAFTYTYWRKTGSVAAHWLSALLLFLIVLSTSSTAYAGLAILVVPVAVTLMQALFSDRLRPVDIKILVVLLALACLILGMSLYDRGFFDPFLRLMDSMVINKGSSASGQERGYWNAKSLEAFADTSGLGVGFGSSRASSWMIAVISQLGLVGSVLMAALVVAIARGMSGLDGWVDQETDAVIASVRACALAGLVAASLVSGSADPGMMFFVALAVVSVGRVKARQNKDAAQSSVSVGRLAYA